MRYFNYFIFGLGLVTIVLFTIFRKKSFENQEEKETLNNAGIAVLSKFIKEHVDQDVDKLLLRIKILEKTLVKIEERCKSLERDCQEGDKVCCHSGQIKLEIARVYPKYSREG